MDSLLTDKATNKSPRSVAAAVPAKTKKSCHCSIGVQCALLQTRRAERANCAR